MVNYRYLGYGVTDANGVAHLDHDANGNPIEGYTGTGAGEVELICSTDNPIGQHSLVSKTVTITDNPSGTVLTVTTDKNVLSYADSDEAIVSATLTGSTISGQSVVFKNGSTVLDTVTTDSSGVAEYTYTSQGVGDVTITAEYSSLSDSVTIEDIFAYTTSISSWDTVTNKGTDYKFSPYTLPTNHRIDIKLNGTGWIRWAVGDKTTVNSGGWLEWIYAIYRDTDKGYTRSSTNEEISNNLTVVTEKNCVASSELDGTTLKIYHNDVLKDTLTTYDPLSLTRLLRINATDVEHIEYIKVKAL